MIWKFYSLYAKFKDEEAGCNLCKRVIKYGSSVTNLKSHFQRKYPAVEIFPANNLKGNNVQR